jgi:hypothetical protein
LKDNLPAGTSKSKRTKINLTYIYHVQKQIIICSYSYASYEFKKTQKNGGSVILGIFEIYGEVQ